ncbi:magnesium-transporting ATPase [Enemella dayhoffiae]|uniref:Magnesium-transporting ATPase n=1 Tax=Enemella dayhoffiae TaxID=2016507 RepID=A0A255H9Q5_9ACTN|nr:HAD-IC family P-type ATPase [Enemella dayhoffiae]OYO24339.1 magnesium-transporting ATPase [Enemella dayhoffiae]
MNDAEPDSGRGLTSAEVAQRREAGQVNTLPDRSGRSVPDIVRANVFTRINAILGVLLVVVLSTGSFKNALFGLLIIANSGIGIIQEVRAKRTLDRLAIIGRAHPLVRRDGTLTRVDQDQLVLDEVIELGPGDQVPVDGVVVESGSLEVDESMLTGEADPVAKDRGDSLLSGSFVVSGSGAFRATAVGAEAYAAKLAAEASRFTLVDSELRRGIDTILRLVGLLLVPTGILTVIVQLFVVHADLRTALLGMVAALVPMVPEGLVLLTSVAFAVGVVRLGRRQCLVQELPAIEGLARVDVVCTDKTGTLTENGMRVAEIIPVATDPAHDPVELLRQLAATDPRPNASMAAVVDALGTTEAPWPVAALAPFTSARKWSGATFESGRSLVLGAPDVLAEQGSPAARRAEELGSQGLRVLLLASGDNRVDGEAATVGLLPLALVVLEQRLRTDAGEILDYFARQNVSVKMVSGDNAISVGAIARQVELGSDSPPIDARSLPQQESEFADAVTAGSVFGRVSPEQKRQLVHALQGRGHTVAMTGDGVNDVLALKDADIGVAMGAGSEASRAVAQIVLLDNRFATLPHVVAEGRRVIGNIERVATLFLTKTVYSVLLALLVGAFTMPFPFVPLHITITAWFTIGIPAFLLSLAPNAERARSGFVRRVMGRAVPAGVIIAVASFVTYRLLFSRIAAGEASREQVSSAVLIVVIAIAMWVLAVVARPYRPWKVALLVLSVVAYVAMFTIPVLARFFTLDVGRPEMLVVPAVAAIIGIVLVEVSWLVGNRLRARSASGPGWAVRGSAA